MKKKPNLFDEYSRGEEVHARRASAAAAAYEAGRVEYLLRRCGMMPQTGRRLRALHEAAHGHQALRFATFNAEYESYPLLLGTANLTGLHTEAACFLPALFARFADTPFTAAYEEFYALAAPRAHGRAIGLVFPRKGIPQGLIIHDGADLPRRVFRGTVLTYRARKGDHQLFVQPYQGLVDQVHAAGHGWRP